MTYLLCYLAVGCLVLLGVIAAIATVNEQNPRHPALDRLRAAFPAQGLGLSALLTVLLIVVAWPILIYEVLRGDS